MPLTYVNQALKFRSGGGGGGHGAYDQRIKGIAKMLKKSWVVGGKWGVRGDMNKELKLLLKLQNKKLRAVRSRGWVGVRVIANIKLKLLSKCKKNEEKKRLVGGDRRIEVIVKMQEKKSKGEELARVDVNEELKIEVRIDVNEKLKLW